MARRLRAGGESQEVLVAREAGFAPDGLDGLKPLCQSWSRTLVFSNGLEIYHSMHTYMHSSVRGLIVETSVPVGDIALTRADHVAAGHALDGIRVNMTARKIRWASSTWKAGKNLMNRHKRPIDVWRQLESRHAPKTMGETSMLLNKYEQYKIAPTRDSVVDIAALSDVRAQLSVREIVITDQTFCVRVLDTLPREYEYEIRHFNLRCLRSP